MFRIEALPATVSEHEEENTEDDAGGANMDADDDAAQRGLSIPALTQTVPSWKQTALTHTHFIFSSILLIP